MITTDDLASIIRVNITKIGHKRNKHVFLCSYIDSSENGWLRFCYISNYKNLSVPNRHGSKARDLSFSSGCDRQLRTKDWDITMECELINRRNL